MSGAYSTSKLFTRNCLLSPFQCGFCKQHLQLSFVDTIRWNIDHGFMTGAVFVDLLKAFDTIEHSKLLASVVPRLILYT